MYPPPFLFLKEKKQKNFRAPRGLVVDLAEATATKRGLFLVTLLSIA